MKKILVCLTAQIVSLLVPALVFAHEDLNFEYICSVTNKNKEGQFRDVVNVVFLPYWQRMSHLYHDDQKDIWFEIAPVINALGKVEEYQMELKLYTLNPLKPVFSVHGLEQSEIGFGYDELNIGAHCFHRSQRGKAGFLKEFQR